MEKQLARERYKLLHAMERLFEGPMIFLGFVWLALLIYEFIYGLSTALQYISLGIWVLFILDFLLKFVLAPRKIVFLKKQWLTAISLVIPALRVFRAFRAVQLLRSLRGIRLVRVVSSVNRSMRSLTATMARRGFVYVFLATIVVVFAGAAGMFALEQRSAGFESYGSALWWTAMRVVTAGSESWPVSPEGRILAFLIALYGYTIFGYVTATLATFFIGRDAEEKDAPIVGANEVRQLRKELTMLREMLSRERTDKG